MSFSEDLHRMNTSQSTFELHDILIYMAGFFMRRVFTEGYFLID